MDSIENDGMTQEQKEKYAEAERMIAQWRELGKRASAMLYEAREGIASITWFDHRHHLLNPEVEWVDFWTISADNVLGKIPIDGTVLDLCCGDGFYDYHFYRWRARQLLGIDISPQAISLARREHSAANIAYELGDVLTYDLPSRHYDTIICRGAIEHFTEEEQIALLVKISNALKPGGWFCGDTVTPQGENEAHKNEWRDESDMRTTLCKAFVHVETDVLVSKTRTTLLWRCQR